MEKKNLKDAIGSVLLLLFFGGFYIITLGVNEKVRTYPTIILTAGFVLTAINLARALYRMKSNKPTEVSAPMTLDQLIGCVVTVVSAFLYAFLSKIVGYIVTTTVFVALFSIFVSYRNKKWSKLWTYPVVALGTALALYFTFKFFLNVPLPKGFLI